MTDGLQTKDKGIYTPLDRASQPIKDKGVEVWAIGIGGDADRRELEQIASDTNKVLQVSSFEKLHEIWEVIKKGACKPSK